MKEGEGELRKSLVGREEGVNRPSVILLHPRNRASMLPVSKPVAIHDPSIL